MHSNPKHITCFEVFIQPWVPLKLIFSLGVVVLTVVSLALLLLTRLMLAFTPNSTQLTLTVFCLSVHTETASRNTLDKAQSLTSCLHFFVLNSPLLLVLSAKL